MQWRRRTYQATFHLLDCTLKRGSNLQTCRGQFRFVSTSTKNDPARIRNLAVVAHIDSGKTTLTESILLRSGYLSAPGTVDTGSTTTDFLPAERERGITIQSASIPVSWKEWSINLIDTPGHADFGMEVESASRVVDGAVVLIDAVEGVESQTQGVWKQLDRYQVPSRMLFLNKMDRVGASFRSSMQSILNFKLHPNPMPITLPVASFDVNAYSTAEPGIEGIVDLVRWEVWKWDASKRDSNGDTSVSVLPLPDTVEGLEQSDIFPSNHPLVKELVPARTAFLENLSMFSEELMDEVLSLPSDPSAYLSVKSKAILPALRSAVLQNKVLPVLCGSAMKHIGTDLVLNYAGHLLSSPLDVPGALVSQSSDNVQMLAWKVTWDKRRGWMTFVRIYSGSLHRQSTLFNVTRGQKEKVSKLLLLYASQPEEVETLTFGDVGVLIGLKHTRTGDTLISGHQHTASTKHRNQQQQLQEDESLSPLRDISPPPAVMSSAIIPQSTSDLQPVQDALLALSRTDPSARVEISEGQLLVHGLGALHLEIIEGRLKDEWGVAFESGRRRVSYREAFVEGQDLEVEDSWSTELHGRTVNVKVELEIRALEEDETGDPAWDENIILTRNGRTLRPPNKDGIVSSQEAQNPLTYIAQGVSNSLISSPHTTLPLSRTRILVRRFSISPHDTPISVLAGAVSIVIRRAVQKAGQGALMEPYVRLKISLGEEHIGRVVKDLTERGGEVVDLGGLNEADEGIAYSEEGVYLPPDWVTPSVLSASKAGRAGSLKRSINVIAPLSQVLDFNTRLRSLSGGHGTFEMVNDGFRPVTESRRLEIMKELGRA